MPIDLEVEELIPLTTEAAGTKVPGYKRVSKQRLDRWRKDGVDGVKLECVRVGQPWFTSREAIFRFIHLLSYGKVVEMPSQRSRRLEAVMSELETLGIKPTPKELSKTDKTSSEAA